MVAFASCWKPDGRQTKIVAEIKGEEVDYPIYNTLLALQRN